MQPSNPPNPQSPLRLHPSFDAVFSCDLCEFVASGPTPLEEHVRAVHSVPVGSVAGVPVHAANAEPKRCGRPRKGKA